MSQSPVVPKTGSADAIGPILLHVVRFYPAQVTELRGLITFAAATDSGLAQIEEYGSRK